jgi:hypothetical protein
VIFALLDEGLDDGEERERDDGEGEQVHGRGGAGAMRGGGCELPETTAHIPPMREPGKWDGLVCEMLKRIDEMVPHTPSFGPL